MYNFKQKYNQKFYSRLVAILALQIVGIFFLPFSLTEITKPSIAQAAGEDDFFNSINALPDCSSVSAGVVCKWKTVPFESQAEINSYTESAGWGYDPDDNDVITYDPTVGMARVAIPAFSPTVTFYTLTESPKTSISPTDQCLKFQNLPNHIGYGDPLVIGDYPNGTFEVILVQDDSSCPRVAGAGGQTYVTRGINNTTPQAWANGSPIRAAIKKVGVGNTLDVRLNTEGVTSSSAPNQGCGPACTTWYVTFDSVYDKSYLGQNKLPAGKTFSIGGAGDKSMFTMQVGNDCEDAHGVTAPGCDRSKDISGKVNLRHGAPQRSGGGPDWKLTDGITNCSLSGCEVPTLGDDNGYRPQVGALIMRPNTVLRWHILIEAKYGDYDRVTLWLSDQNNNAVLIHNRLMMSLGQDSAMPNYDAAKYPTPNQISYWHLGMDVSSYGLFTNTTYRDLVSWFGNLTLVRGLTRQQIEANYLPVKPAVPTSSNIAPYVSITNPAKNGINYPVDTNILFTATASDFDGSVSKVEFLKNNILIQGCTNFTTPYFCSLPLDTSGSFVLTARATDNKGLISTSNPITVATDGTTPPPSDITPPTTSLTSPASGATVSGTVIITANASDNVAVKGVQFKLDGVNLGPEDTTSPYSYSWNTTQATNGAKSLTAVARDAAGNTKTSTAVSVTVSNTGTPTPDTTPPTVSITSPTVGATLTGTTTLTANATDNVGVAGVQFKLDGSNIGSEDTTSPYSVSWNSATVSNGTHSLTASARDSAGNTTVTSSRTINLSNSVVVPPLVDTTPPTFSNILVSSITASSVVVSWSTNENSTAQIQYGLTTGYGSVVSSSGTITHSVTLSGLASNTTYNFRARAIDLSNNTSYSSNQIFTTLPESGTVSPTPTPTPTPPSTPTSPTPISTPSSPVVVPTLTRTIYIGTRGEDVKSLQNYLIQSNYLSSGNNSGYFGPLTQTAVRRYQCERLAICSGNESINGYGLVGQKTRESILSQNTKTFNTLTTDQRDAIQKQINDLLILVQQLLQKLKELRGL